MLCCLLAAASSTTGPDASEREALPGKNPSTWTIEEVMQFVRDADPMTLAPHAELFRKHVSKHLLWEKNLTIYQSKPNFVEFPVVK